MFDVCIVGAGPAGATCAYYLARAGRRVLLLEKKTFPRDKLCGDAICRNAQIHLERMGVLQEIEAEGKGHWAEVGGLVAPSGVGFIANSTAHSGKRLVVAIKRAILDEKVARAAERAGAVLTEDTSVLGGTLDRGGIWTISARLRGEPVEFSARALVAADGALSRLTQALGIPTPPPDGICSRAYIKAGTHQFDADGVVFYASDMVPGYAALFKEAGGDVNFCCYIIPGGKAKLEDLHALHHRFLEENVHVRRALGPNAQIEKMRGAPLRLGGIRRSYHDHLLIIGDAAGHIDPLTGEGIHVGMDGAEIAADVLDHALATRDLRARALEPYQDRWMRAFGRDFAWSAAMAKFYSRFPLFIDASARVMQKKGVATMTEWAYVMTGVQPKTHFLRPRMFLPILLEAARLAIRPRRGSVHRVDAGVTRRWQDDDAAPVALVAR